MYLISDKRSRFFKSLTDPASSSKSLPGWSNEKVTTARCGTPPMSNDRQARLRVRAYEIWEREGRPNGRERVHWEQAVRELDGVEAAHFDADGSRPETAPPHRKKKGRAPRKLQRLSSKPKF